MKTTLQPDCLRWARERAGLSVPDLAKKLKVGEGKVVAWEQSGEITLSNAEKLARATYVPIGALFLPNPPNEKLPIKDFRTVNSQGVSVSSPELLEVVNEALLRQDWYRDYIIDNDGEELAFVGSLKPSHDYSGAAKRIRDEIDWDVEDWDQNTKRTLSWEFVLSGRIEAVEKVGILVMRSGIVNNNSHRSLSLSIFRGFALSDNYAPLIFINGQDAKAAQMFTLAHELVHVWLGESGVTNLDQTRPSEIGVEPFCNAVAAELLVPLEAIKGYWPLTGPDDRITTNRIKQTAKHFRVSSLVILRRLLDAKFIRDEDFQRLYTDEVTQFGKAPKRGGGDYYHLVHTRLGKRFVSALVDSTLSGATSYRDAFDLLGVKNAEQVRQLATRLRVTA